MTADGGEHEHAHVRAGPVRGQAVWDENLRSRRDQRDGMWRGAVAITAVIGVVLATSLLVAEWSTAESEQVARRQRLRLAAEKVAVTGSKLVSALATWSHPRQPTPRASTGGGTLRKEVAVEVAKALGATGAPFEGSDAELGGDEAELELKWVRQELKSSNQAKRQDAESLAIQRAKREAQEKDLTIVTDELAQLRQEIKDRDEEVTRARARIARGEKALLSKEVEIAELKEQLSKRAATHTAQLAASDKKRKGDSKLYEESMTCEKKLNAVKDSLLKTTQELSQKKKDFRKFLSMLQSTWSETKNLKAQIDSLESQKAASVLEGAMAAEAGKELSSDGGRALSTKDRVLKLLGVVQNGNTGSNSEEKSDRHQTSSTDDADW